MNTVYLSNHPVLGPAVQFELHDNTFTANNFDALSMVRLFGNMRLFDFGSTVCAAEVSMSPSNLFAKINSSCWCLYLASLPSRVTFTYVMNQTQSVPYSGETHSYEELRSVVMAYKEFFYYYKDMPLAVVET